LRLLHQIVLLLVATLALASISAATRAADARPNILFCIADDWGWPHAGAYGDKVVQTPAFDRIAREGVLFNHAYVSSPSCTPCRGAILTGQWHWRLEAGANLWCVFPDKFAAYLEILKAAGYFVGHSGKAWGPGRTETPGRQIAGAGYKSFQAFMADRPKETPFCFWLGTSDPHRPYKKDSGADSGMDLSKVHLFGHYPDAPEVRGDVADYYWEVQRWDTLVAKALDTLEAAGEIENTLIVMTGDHGMPFPRCKANLYDSGTRVPLAIRWGEKVKPGRAIDDFVSLTDLAPTFLEAAGVAIPADMTGRSLLSILTGDKSGRVDPARDFVLTGKERHCPCQEAPDPGGYPCRAIRTYGYLYIRNFTPQRWPAGTPNYAKAHIKNAWYADCDNSPTKTYIIENKDKDEAHRRAYELSFAKRPAEELYDLSKDSGQLHNVAAEAEYAKVKADLAAELTKHLKATGDPRVLGRGEELEKHPYLGGAPKYPR